MSFKSKLRNAFSKENVKLRAMDVTSSVFGTLHFTAQATADLMRASEAEIIHLIDKNQDRATVRRVRNVKYIKNRALCMIALCQAELRRIELVDEAKERMASVKHRLTHGAADRNMILVQDEEHVTAS